MYRPNDIIMRFIAATILLTATFWLLGDIR
jgi:hypothetical protein